MAGLLDDPYYAVPGHEGLRKPKQKPADDRIWQERVRDTGNEWANYLVGPHMPAVEGLLQFSDAADLQDAADNNSELYNAVSEGRWGDAAYAAPWAGVSSLAAVIPGISAGPFDNITRRGPDVAPSAMGIKAYHGSPHSFDKFSMSKLGTGEGAQAYGHGLYFAENEGVAKSYRDDLSSGTVLNVRPQTSAEEEVLSRIKNYSDEYGGVPEEATVYKDILNDYERAGEWIPAYKDMLNRAGGGSMYEVNIDANPNADFINYDAPWSEQPQKVKDAFHYLSKNQPDGSDLAKRIEAPIFAQEASDRGVKGIQFLDAGSRGKGIAQVQVMYKGQPHGDPIPVQAWNQVDQLTNDYRAKGYDVEVQDLGTRNYVVFDDNLINIIKKYGIAGLLGAGGMYGMSSDEAQAGAR